MIREFFEHVSGRKDEIDNRTVFFKAIERILPNVVRKVGQKNIEVLCTLRTSLGTVSRDESIADNTFPDSISGLMPNSFDHVRNKKWIFKSIPRLSVNQAWGFPRKNRPPQSGSGFLWGGCPTKSKPPLFQMGAFRISLVSGVGIAPSGPLSAGSQTVGFLSRPSSGLEASRSIPIPACTK